MMYLTMDIRRKKQRVTSSRGNIARKAASVVLGVDNKDVEIEATRIEAMCQKFAEIAYSMGETNDTEQYAEQMSESIFEAYKKVEKNQKKEKKKKRGG